MNLEHAVIQMIACFPNAKSADSGTIDAYVKFLSDLDEQAVIAAIQRKIMFNTFLPTIAEIRTDVAEHVVQLPTEEEAWSQVAQQLKTRSQGDGLGPWDVHPAVLLVVREVGTFELRHDERGEHQKKFRAIYREKRSQFMSEVVTGETPLPATTMEALS